MEQWKTTVEEMEMNNILVTGGAGFIGSHLVETLVKKGIRVFVLDLFSPIPSYFSIQKLERKATFVKADVSDFEKINSIIKKYKIDCIFHLAAQALVDEAYNNPRKTLETNIMGTVNILEAARKNSFVKAVIVASSDKAYGKISKLKSQNYENKKASPKDTILESEFHAGVSAHAMSNYLEEEMGNKDKRRALEKFVSEGRLKKEKYSEKDPLCGDHPYEVSKSAADLIAQTYYKTYDLPVAIARFGNVYGKGDLNFNRIIPGIMEAIIRDKTLEIRSNGQYVRDYIYVKDVVRGYLMLTKHINKVKGEAFNFGSEDSLAVIDLIKLISHILNIQIPYKILNIAKNEIPYQSLDWSKIKKYLGWKPRYSISQTIKQIFQWYKNKILLL